MADTLPHSDRSDSQDRPDERQRYQRHQVIVAAKLHDSQGSVDCDVLDLSAGGAKVKAAVPFPAGAEVQLDIPDQRCFRATVAWCQGDYLGLEFHDEPEGVAAAMPAILEAVQDDRERRRHIRSSVIWTAEIYGGLRRAKCEILNVSSAGAKLRTQGHFPIGTQVTIRSIRFGEFQAEVVWQDKEANLIGISIPANDRLAQLLNKCAPKVRGQND